MYNKISGGKLAERASVAGSIPTSAAVFFVSIFIYYK